MQYITELTSHPKQRMQLVLENNETADFYIYYKARMNAWFFDLDYKDLSIKCMRACLHPNILRQFRRNIPFGIAFAADNKVEPWQITSFSSGECGMYVLTSEEVQTIEEEVYNNG